MYVRYLPSERRVRDIDVVAGGRVAPRGNRPVQRRPGRPAMRSRCKATAVRQYHPTTHLKQQEPPTQRRREALPGLQAEEPKCDRSRRAMLPRRQADLRQQSHVSSFARVRTPSKSPRRTPKPIQGANSGQQAGSPSSASHERPLDKRAGGVGALTQFARTPARGSLDSRAITGLHIWQNRTAQTAECRRRNGAPTRPDECRRLHPRPHQGTSRRDRARGAADDLRPLGSPREGSQDRRRPRGRPTGRCRQGSGTLSMRPPWTTRTRGSISRRPADERHERSRDGPGLGAARERGGGPAAVRRRRGVHPPDVLPDLRACSGAGASLTQLARCLPVHCAAAASSLPGRRQLVRGD